MSQEWHTWSTRLIWQRTMGFKVFFSVLASLCLLCSYANSSDSYDEFSAFEDEMFKSRTQIYDPLEPLNRKVFAFNDYADQYLIGYVISSYRFVVPKITRRGIRNFFNNISMPFSIINSFAQGKTDNGLANLSSFMINSTIGVFGIMNISGREKIYYNIEDFGQTLGYYGVNPGPYLVLPFLGPSTARQFSGELIKRALSPTEFDILKINSRINISLDDEDKIAITGLNVIDKRESLTVFIDDAKKDSLDYYLTVRSFYLQNLESNVNQ